MPQELPERQKEYLNFIRNYIQENESAPRLDEIAKHFGVAPPTAHKSLRALQGKGHIYFSRDRVTGFYIRMPQVIGATAPIFETNLIGKINRYGEIIDFAEKFGHFPTTAVDSKQENVFALELWQHIPTAKMQSGDLIIFDQKRTPQPDTIGIIPWGKRWLLSRLFSPIIDENLPFYTLLVENLSEWEAWVKEQNGYFFWWPLAYSEETDRYFANAAIESQIPWRPIPFDYIVATAIRLERPLTF